MDSTGLTRAIRRHARFIVIVVVAGVLLAAAAAALLPRAYTGEATLFLRVQSANTSLYQRSQFAMQRIQSYPQLLDSEDVLGAVIAQTGVDETRQQLASRLSAASTAGTLLLTVTATGSTAQQAADIANAASSALASHVNDLENSQNTTKNAVLLVPQISATAAATASSPDVPAVLGLGLIAGVVAGLLGALALERFRPRLHDVRDVRRVSGLPVVAQLPSGGGSGGADPLDREFVDNLRTLGRGRIAPVLLMLGAGGVDSAVPGRRLARGLAESGRRVLLVESAATAAGGPGLTELLAGTTDIERAVRRSDDGFDVMSAGDAAVLPSTFDLETAFPAVVTPLVAEHDVSVLQAPTGDSGPDLAVVGPFARTALIVVSRRTSTEHDVRLVLGALRALEVLPVGVILTDAPRREPAELVASWQDGDFLQIELGMPARENALVEPPARAVRSER